MADIEEAFAALEQLDERGRKALTLAGAMWEEMWRDAAARAEKASGLRVRLACPIDNEKKAVARATEQQARAEAAEARLATLLQEKQRLRAVGASRGAATSAAREIVAIRELRSRSWLPWAHRPWPRPSSPSSR